MADVLTRRSFLASVSSVPFALRGMAEAPLAKPSWLLIGTDKGAGIYKARWNGATGEIGHPELAIATERPAFLALHPKLPVLYAVNSLSGNRAAVTSFRLNRDTAELQTFNTRETHGDGPCFVSVDRTGQSLFAANYAGGSMTAYKLNPDGSIAQTVGVFRYNQPTHGPVADRQEAAHLHCATISPNNDFVLVCDLGDDLILVFPIAPDRGSYVGAPERVAARAGSGPRHLAFHPNGRWVYCIHELDNTIDMYEWSVSSGKVTMTLREGSIIATTKPFAATAGSTACEVVVSDNGKHLYACTRGENSLAVYAIDPSSGLLSSMQQFSCGGVMPRYFGFDPSGRWLVCANQGSSTLTVFAHAAATGKLKPNGRKFAADSPMFVQWI